MGGQREKCSGGPERKKGQFPYRPKDAPRPEPLPDVPGPDHPRFATIRPSFMQRKDDVEYRRREQLERQRRRIEAIADAKIRRALEREEAERQRGIDEFWKTLNRKVRIKDEVTRHQPGQPRKAQTGRSRGRPSPHALAAYSSPIIDRQGRRGVYMSSTYLSARTSAYGSMRRLSYYVTNPDSLEEVAGERAFFSNMGETRHEIASGMALVEDANRSARANAKIAVTFIVQLPHDVTPKERLTILRLWCEEKLGIHDLPYVAALHKPSQDGDQRNHHGHVVTSFRPAYRIGPYEWRLARGLRTDLDNPAMFEEFRRDFATLMTAVVQVAGIDRVYTHLSHAARGLKHKPTEKLGPGSTRAVRDGEYVPADARNRRTIATNEALAEIERIDERTARHRRRLEQLMALKASAARLLSPALQAPLRGGADRARTISRPLEHVPTPLARATLVAAANVDITSKYAARMGGAGLGDLALTDIPSLQGAPMLDDTHRRLSKLPAISPHGVESRPMSAALQRPDFTARAFKALSAPVLVTRDLVDRRSPSGKLMVEPAEPSRSRELRPVPVVAVTSPICRTLSPPVVAARITAKPRALAPAVSVRRTSAATRPLSIVRPVAKDEPALTARSSAVITVPVSQTVQLRALAVLIEPPQVLAAATCLRSIKNVAWAYRAAVHVLRPMRLLEPTPTGNARALERGTPRLARISRLAEEAERHAEVAVEAERAQLEEERQRRDYHRYIRFLALVALNPDWLADGKQGVGVASHAPTQVRDAYAAWQNDHARLATIAEVRQATFEGVHRLSADLAAGVALVAQQLVPKLPAPPPLRDARGQTAPAIELALALIADHPDWIAASGDPATLSAEAVPALATIIARYREDRALTSLLAAARHHGEGVERSMDVTLARRVDQRRVNISLRSARGALPVVTPDRLRLSPAIIDHLAHASRHPEWIVRHSHLGLGLAATAPPLFRQQWASWKEPALARQLLLDMMGPASRPRALTPAMRSQVMDRITALAGPEAGHRRAPGHEKDEPSR